MADPSTPALPPLPLGAVELRNGGSVAVVDACGARLTRYRVGGRDVLAGREHGDLFAYRGSLLAPWPNRVTDGRWHWRGEDFQLPLNDPTGVNAALHGLVVDGVFHPTSRTDSSVVLVHHLQPSPGYPFSLRLEVAYTLTDRALECSLAAVNTGDADAPVGLGVHPYVDAQGLVDDVELTLPAATVLEVDDQWREVGRRRVEEAGVDFRRGRRLGDLEVDAAFTDLIRTDDGRVEVVLGVADGAEVVLSSGGTCTWLQVYTGHTLPDEDRRRSIAVEPMTCPPNALATGEIDVLAPGSSLALDWSFTLR